MKILKQRMLSYSYSLSSALASTLKKMLQEHVSKMPPQNRALAWGTRLAWKPGGTIPPLVRNISIQTATDLEKQQHLNTLIFFL